MIPDGSKLPTLNPLDKRLNAMRPDLADISLEGKVEAERFVEGRPARVSSFFADLHCKQPVAGQGKQALDAQLLHGEAVEIFDEQEGWSWVKSKRNGYVGWVDCNSVSVDMPQPTHRVIHPRTFLYPGPDMKLPRADYRSMGSLITVTGEAETRGTKYAILSSGEAIIARHVAPIDFQFDDFVSVAETLIHTPYLWGGDTAFGIDCSGLVGLSLAMCGHDVLRDSDMQGATIGEVVTGFEKWSDLKRGDLIYWRGHTGICQGTDDHGIPMLIHANGHTMSVISEPLEGAIERIAFLYEYPIGVRRPNFSNS